MNGIMPKPSTPSPRKTCAETDDCIKSIMIMYHDIEEYMDYIFTDNGQSDWIDLRASKTVELHAGEYAIIPLGVSMRLPDGYEAHLAPRSSTFKNFGILQVNGVGVIDNSYSGDDDIWGMPALAMRDTVIHKGERICQFRIMRKMDQVCFKTVYHLSDKSRGGFGSTGVS